MADRGHADADQIVGRQLQQISLPPGRGSRSPSASAIAATNCISPSIGRNAILGEREPMKAMPAHELGIVVQGVAPTKAMAEEVCMIATRQMSYARLPQVKGTAGGVAFLLDEVMPASPAYRGTLNHTMRLDDPLELFPTFIVEAGI